MLQPGFFADSPTGTEPQKHIPKTSTMSEVAPQTHVATPHDMVVMPKFISFADFPKAHEIIKPPLIVDKILHQGSKFVLAAPSKFGKSWAMMDMAISVATGQKFWDLETTQKDVLFIDFELQPCFAMDRLWAVLHAKGLSAPPRSFMYWPLRGRCYDAKRVLAILEERMSDYPNLGLVCADPVYKLASQIDENNAGNVTELLLTLEQFSEKTGASFAFTHHFNKQGSSADGEHVSKMSGSGAWARDPDAILTLSRHRSEPDCMIVESTLRNLPSPPPFVMEFTPPQFIRRDDIEIETPRARKSPGVDSSKILQILEESSPLAPKEWEARSIRKYGITSKQFEHIVSGLRSSKTVYIARDGDGYLFHPEETK